MIEDTLELDCRAMLCPQPIIELARHIGDVEIGDLVVVVATDPAARHDVPAWCRMRGHEHVGSEVGTHGVARHTVRRLS